MQANALDWKSHGAMENWGLVTYRTTAVLFDEKTSDSGYKNRIAYVVAHGRIAYLHVSFGHLAYRPHRTRTSMVRKPCHDGLVV